MTLIRLLLAVLLIASPAVAADPEPRLLLAGFAREKPEPASARSGAYDRTDLTLYSPALGFWVDVAALSAGDHLLLSLKSPDGGIMATRDIPFDRATDRFFAFTRSTRPQRGWQTGAYVGRIQVIRGDQILIEATRQIALP
jgi:hypothetical protein